MLASSGTRVGEAGAGGVHLGGCAQRLDEERVDAGGEVGLGAVEGRVQPFDGQRVGARQDQRVGAAARVQRRMQLAGHLGHRDHGLAVEVAAAFGEALVFQLDHRGAGALEGTHRALRVQRIAEAGVGVDDHRQRHALGDARQRVFHLGGGGQPDVGAAQPRVGDGRARQVQRLEAGLLGDQCRQRVVDARGQQRRGLCQSLFQRHAVSSSARAAARRCARRPRR
jgi:hypothetical protein